VTTPQAAAQKVARRAADVASKTGMRVAGVIENMSHLVCACCGEVTHPFGQGGGQELADELGVPLLGQVPLDERLRVTADEGVPLVVAEPENATAKAVRELAVAVPAVLRRAAVRSASRSRSQSSSRVPSYPRRISSTAGSMRLPSGHIRSSRFSTPA
jgi:ATP-binding protein involved in chromosome partitioning